jgi:hypothetical protein
MNLFDVLSNDQRVIVHSDASARMIYTWNHSLTLQAWSVRSIITEEACRTLSTKPINIEDARRAAMKWSEG